MASVISSARRSTASVFDVIGETADAVTKVIRAGARAADTLDLKARELHEGVRVRSLSNIVVTKNREIMLAARDYVDLLEENYAYTTGKTDFDREAQYQAIVAQMEQALNDEN